jgi:NADPH-dependent 7-cyano-7-deazaguanine reductase QueF
VLPDRFPASAGEAAHEREPYADELRLALKTVADPHPALRSRQAHIIDLPELCPASRNPGAGSLLCIRYRSHGRFLEIFSLAVYIRAFVGHPIVRDVEMLTQIVAMDCAQVLGHKVRVRALYRLPALGQQVRTQVVARPRSTPMRPAVGGPRP